MEKMGFKTCFKILWNHSGRVNHLAAHSNTLFQYGKKHDHPPDFVQGMTSLQGDADLKLSAGVINCERYCGAMSCMHLKTISSNFNLMRCSTGSQWRFFSIGVTSSLLDLATRQAAMFCRCCNFLMDFFGIRQALSCSSRFWMQEGYAPWSHKHVEICSIWWMTMPLFGTLPSCTSHARGPSSILNCEKWLQCFMHFFNDGVMDELSTFNTSSGIAFF